MSKSAGIILLIFFFVSLLGCERISQKVEDRINQKIDKTIDESLNKIDTLIRREKLDSIKSRLDTSMKKIKEKINK